MDEEEELENTLIGQNPMMEEQPILSVEDNRIGGNGQEALALTGALAGIRTNPFLTGSMNQAPAPSLNPATGPSGGTRLPTQPSLEQASRAASRTAGMGSYGGATGELSRGRGFDIDLNSNRIGSSFASNVAKGATQGMIGFPSLVLNPNEMGDATLSGANQRAADQGLPLPFPDAPNAEVLQLVQPSSAENEVEQKPGFFEPGGFGYEYLGPRLVNTLGDLGERFGQFSGEQLYGTGITAEGQPTGFPVDRPTLAGDIATLPGNVLRGLDFFAGPVVDLAADKAPVIADYVTGDTGVQAQQEKAAGDIPIANAPTADGTMGIAKVDPTGTMGIAEVAPTLPPVVQSDTGNNIAESTPSLPEGVQEGSPQANFLNRMRSGEALTQEEINAANALAESIGTTFDPVTGYNRDPFLSSQASRTSTPLPGQTLTQFLRNEDALEQRTEQFVDPQGRIRRRLTPQASALQGFAPGVQPLAPEYAGFQQASDDLQQRLRDRARREGETQTERDTRIARSRTQGSSRGGLSQADARDLAQGLAKDATEGQRMRALQIQSRLGLDQFKPEKELSDLEKREIESQIREREAGIAAQKRKGGFEPRVIDVGGERAMELSPGYFQRIAKDKPNKTGLQTTLENLQADLDSGRLTQEQYDIAVGNAKNIYIGLKEPKQNEIDVQERIDQIRQETMGATPTEGNELPDSLKNSNPSQFTGQTIEDKEGNRYTSDGTKWTKI